jgi:hypothetical protein
VAVVDEPLAKNQKFANFVWVLLQAWVVGVLVATVSYPFIFNLLADSVRSTHSPSTLHIAGMFLAVAYLGLVLTVPFMILAGVIAFIMRTRISNNPLLTTIIAPLIALWIFATFIPVGYTYGDNGPYAEYAIKNALTREGLLIYLALTASTAYFSFKLRALKLWQNQTNRCNE